MRTTAGSKILGPFVPPYESTVTANLLRDGAVFLGKTNMDEFAMGSSNMTSAYGPVENPWKRRQDDSAVLVPGGSSGGSAAAVAARLAMGATGTDTGGSIRQPASFCGLVGVKPTYGRCSRWGVVAFASSLDHPGPFARTVRDGAILLGSMAGHDPKDSTSAGGAGAGFRGRLRARREGAADRRAARISRPTACRRRSRRCGSRASTGCARRGPRSSMSRCRTRNTASPPTTSSHRRRRRRTWRATTACGSGCATNGEDLRDLYERTRAEGFGAEVRRRVLIGTYVLSAGYYDAYYLRAQKIRALILRDFTDAFAEVDALLTPTAPSAAFAQGEKMDDPVQMYLNDLFTVPADLAGVPAMSVPAGLDANGLPLGLQVIGKPFDEETVFAVVAALEQAAGFTALPTIRARQIALHQCCKSGSGRRLPSDMSALVPLSR